MLLNRILMIVDYLNFRLIWSPLKALIWAYIFHELFYVIDTTVKLTIYSGIKYMCLFTPKLKLWSFEPFTLTPLKFMELQVTEPYFFWNILKYYWSIISTKMPSGSRSFHGSCSLCCTSWVYINCTLIQKTLFNKIRKKILQLREKA